MDTPGREDIESEKPFSAKLVRDSTAWLVESKVPEGWLGGIAMAIIRKSDGKILYVIHEK
jgi:hypothetical protein